MHYEEMLDMAGIGKFQYLLLFICGLGNAADAVRSALRCVSDFPNSVFRQSRTRVVMYKWYVVHWKKSAGLPIRAAARGLTVVGANTEGGTQVEILAVSLIMPSAGLELGLDDAQKGWLSGCIFIGMLVGGRIPTEVPFPSPQALSNVNVCVKTLSIGALI